jgi:hypothetical protein
MRLGSLIRLQQHRRGHHPRRHRWASQRRALEQIGEILIAKQRITVLGQQPIHAALHQLIAHQQQHVIESALPILTPQRHTPIFSAHPTNPVQARRNRAAKSAASWVVDRTRRRAASRLPNGCSPVLSDA